MTSFLGNFILNDAKVISNKINFSEIKNKIILITGASGLIGHYLVATIKNASESGNTPKELIVISRNQFPEYFNIFLKKIPVKILSGDLTNDEFLSTLPAADYIIHSAGYGQPGKFMSDPVKTLKLNTLTTFHLLEKLNSKGKFLFMSSSEVYSGLPEPPFKEEQISCANTNHPRFCYIEGKRGGEAIVNAYRIKGVNAKSVRLSLAYGPGTKEDDMRVLNNFIKKALIYKKIDLLDRGEAKRTYIYVTDAAEIIFNVLFFGKSDIYNLGGNSHTNISNLATTIGQYLNVPVNFPEDSFNSLQGAPDDVFLDMNKVRDEFGKKDFFPMEEGLKKTIEWQNKLYLK